MLPRCLQKRRDFLPVRCRGRPTLPINERKRTVAETGPIPVDLHVTVEARVRKREVVHRCPPRDSGTMPCCGQTPFEVSRQDRMTVNTALVTCKGRGAS